MPTPLPVSSTFYATLSGPDEVFPDAASAAAAAASFSLKSVTVGSLSGSDVSFTDSISSKTKTDAVTSKATGIGSLSIGTEHVESFETASYDPFDASSPYYFMGSMSLEVMHRYLDKKLVMEQLCQWYDVLAWGGQGPQSDDEFLADIAMIKDIHPKFVQGLIGIIGGFDWGSLSADNPLNWVIPERLSIVNEQLHAFDPEMILEANIEEFILPTVSLIQVPNEILVKFFPHGMAFRNFIYEDMMYPGKPGYISVVMPEAQMWIYYLATTFIDNGCEALIFGDIPVMTTDADNELIDLGFQSMWLVLQMIRDYAKTHARRGICLMNSHVFGKWGSVLDIHEKFLGLAYYYDPPDMAILPNPYRQLLFDYHQLGVIYSRPDNWAAHCSDALGNLPLEILSGIGSTTILLNNSLGGLNPQGWYCAHNPISLHFDLGGVGLDSGGITGCVLPNTEEVGVTYGYDNCDWYVANSYENRNLIAIYNYYRIKCLDVNAHFSLPGRLLYFPDAVGGPGYIPGAYTLPAYRAETPPPLALPGPGNGGQQRTLKAIFSGYYDLLGNWVPGSYSSPFNWVLHNFTIEEVSNGLNNVSSRLIFVGDDKIFYIATDGWIYGYVHIYDTWMGVCPSSAAFDFDHIPQTQAKSDLVASPNGQILLYIGVDGYIHGLHIYDIWSYGYLDIFWYPMSGQSIKAFGSLIFPANDRFYYIGTYTGSSVPDRGNHVHGFQSDTVPGSWTPVSPTYSAVTSGAAITSQQQAAGALTYNTKPGRPDDRIYYKGNDGYFYYYQVNSVVDYDYISILAMAGAYAIFIVQQLAIQGNLAIAGNRIYFVGRINDVHNPNYGSLWVYCIIDNDYFWSGVSPSFSGYTPLSLQLQSIPTGNIAVSPDGNTIAYFGKEVFDHFICYYHNIDGINYSFNKISIIDTGSIDFNSLQFRTNNDLYFIDPNGNNNVFHLVFEEDHCNNIYAAQYPDTFSA